MAGTGEEGKLLGNTKPWSLVLEHSPAGGWYARAADPLEDSPNVTLQVTTASVSEPGMQFDSAHANHTGILVGKNCLKSPSPRLTGHFMLLCAGSGGDSAVFPANLGLDGLWPLARKHARVFAGAVMKSKSLTKTSLKSCSDHNTRSTPDPALAPEHKFKRALYTLRSPNGRPQKQVGLYAQMSLGNRDGLPVCPDEDWYPADIARPAAAVQSASGVLRPLDMAEVCTAVSSALNITCSIVKRGDEAHAQTAKRKGGKSALSEDSTVQDLVCAALLAVITDDPTVKPTTIDCAVYAYVDACSDVTPMEAQNKRQKMGILLSPPPPLCARTHTLSLTPSLACSLSSCMWLTGTVA
jgi:hypothetical protein